jgi:hypothetical protein
MFESFKVVISMASPIAASEHILLDTLLSAAKAKEYFGDDYFLGKPNSNNLKKIDIPLDRKFDVFCGSIAFGDHKESIGSWSKRWDSKNDELVNFNKKSKARVDIGGGYYKNYHQPIILKSYKDIIFYGNGDIEETERLLKTYIFFIGKKISQGYGEIRDIEVVKTDYDYSVLKEGKPTRPIPSREINLDCETMPHSTLPPYWRTDCVELCYMP